jgi:predicted alpha/beta-fold hydrolase
MVKMPPQTELPNPRRSQDHRVVPFEPHPLLRNCHLQTLIGAWFFGTAPAGTGSTVTHRVVLPDGDQLVVHEDRPVQWQPPDPVAVLLHGLCGSAESPYMARIACKLNARGRRTFRVNWRGAGAGHGLARHAYHAGRSDDLAAVVDYVHALAPHSPITAAGFSLGGNILLKWLGESSDASSPLVSRAAAVNPPLDLQLCTAHLSTIWGGWYDRHFAKLLYQYVCRTPHWREAMPAAWSTRRPRRLVDFDDQFTAPRAGFASAADYYDRCSAARVISQIACPTLILSSRDDPLVPVGIFETLELPECVRLHLAACGGHLGYISRTAGTDPDRLWMDWRVVDWLCAD